MRQDWRIVALFVCSILAVASIVGGPLIYSVKLSLYASTSFLEPPHWVGFRNYINVLTDPMFWGALLNGTIISLSAIVMQVVIGTSIAVILNMEFVGRGFVRAISLLPYFMPPVVACLVAIWLFEPNYGLIQETLESVGMGMFYWGAYGWSAKGMIVLISVWLWTPFVTTCVLAGLQAIPMQRYEAARVDGASAWKQFWHVTVPGLRSVFIVVILLRGIWMFNKFEVIWLTTKGGPLHQTDTLATLSYRRAFIQFDLGTGATIATISFFIMVIITLVYLRFMSMDGDRQGN